MRLGLVLGDQLSFDLASLAALDPARDAVLMAEVEGEARYVPHHPLKIVLIFSAMRHFAQALRERGWCEEVDKAWREGRVPLNAAEGFIRQLIGWREYVRGVYWLRMPEYAGLNHLGNQRALPDFYWTGRTRMRCMQQAIGQTLRLGYAHHIQRLMVTGNFALLAGIAPTAICEWYLAVYMDAFDWVELPNTLGMVMHADGGYLGSKPYCASGRYIQRMSDHCKACSYKVDLVIEDDGCPFNALYWHFLIRHRPLLSTNPRLALVYRSLDGMTASRRDAVWQRGQALLAQLDAQQAL